jgi:branched-chain amino acid transport system permease protein
MFDLRSKVPALSWKMVADDRWLPFTGLVLAGFLALIPLTGPSNYLLHITVLVFVYVTLGLGLNIVVGFAGLLDLGYVAFYAVGAYSYALLSNQYGIPFWAALVVGAVLAAIIGVILGWPTIRTRGDYLALVTLGFGEMIRLLLRNWNEVTNGPRGLMNIAPPAVGDFVFLTPLHFYYLGLLLAVCVSLIAWRVKFSAVGVQLTAIKDDEDAASAIGINPLRWKLYAFAVGASVAGLAGVFFASWQQFVSPESFTLGESILVLSIVVLGGMGRIWPVIAAACFLVLLPEALRGLETYRILVLGVTLVSVVIVQEKLRLRALNRPTTPRHDPDPQQPTEFSSPGERSNHSGAEFLLSITEISKRFDGVRALEAVSLNVVNGEIIGLVGANGAGKTTLLRCISGAIKPDAGQISLEHSGRKDVLTGLAPFQVARKGIVRTFQQPRLFRSLTAGANVEIGISGRSVPAFWEPLVGRKKEDLSNFSCELLQSIGGPAPETATGEMAFVDQKMTELARAISTQPHVLLLDEPASGMERDARDRLVEALRWVNGVLGITLIIVEHDLEFLTSLCKRITVMNQGQIVADGAPDAPKVGKAICETYETTWTPNAIA